MNIYIIAPFMSFLPFLRYTQSLHYTTTTVQMSLNVNIRLASENAKQPVRAGLNNILMYSGYGCARPSSCVYYHWREQEMFKMPYRQRQG